MKRAISFAVFFVAASFTLSAQEVAQNNVKPVNNSLEMVSKLQPVSFNYDKAWAERLKLPSTPQYGFVGADAKAAVPSVVAVQAKQYPAGKNAFNSATMTKVDYERLIPLLVGSIKEQQQQIDELKQELQSLKIQKGE
ncbi:tail fiber domain-containing protein [Pedobacter aquatilis]|uniref:tail fiber domain-containing protein n=1 Tax=Pedobacter aquatilis TaxID=351343 RepID=UPI0025B4D1D1|nr:tail fiber domain-containing protein [Pedobacter aquatilis]MDN3587982.1 tail fiber domain-containing protein [Pedobacter aquatilis]